MNEEEFIKTVVKSIVGEVPEKIYEDGFRSVTLQLGKALGTLGEVFNSAISPIKLGVEEVKLFERKQELRRYNSLLKYANNLQFIPNEKIVEVPSEILIPIMERFSYTSNEELSNAFINLLTKASSSDTANLAHPSFIHILDRLSSDEAKLLNHFNNNKNLLILISGELFAHLNIDQIFRDVNRQGQVFDMGMGHHTEKIDFSFSEQEILSEYLSIQFSENLNFYLENLESLGLIKDIKDQTNAKDKIDIKKHINNAENKYDFKSLKLDKKYFPQEKFSHIYDNPEKYKYHFDYRFKTEFRLFELTTLGLSLIKACFKMKQ